MRNFALPFVSLLALMIPNAALAEVVVNPDTPALDRLTREVALASREMARSTERYPSVSTENFECHTNALDIWATVCTSRDAKMRIVQPTAQNAITFLILIKDENGEVRASEMTIVGAAGDRHLATGDSIRFFTPLDIQPFSSF